MSLFRRESRDGWTAAPVIPPFPGVDIMGGANPSMTNSMRVSAVWACVRLVADTISMLPLHNFRVDAGGVRTPIPDPAWIERPDGVNTQADWVYMMVVSLMLRGCAPGEIISRGFDGYPTAIRWHNYDKLGFDKGPDGRLIIRTPGGGTIDSGNQFLVQGYRMPGFPLGLSPISYAATTLMTDAEVQKFALGYFKDALHPDSVITSDQAISQADSRSIKDRIMELRGKREPLILGGNLKIARMAVTPDESQFLNTQKWSVATICRIFGVPPEMVAAEAGNSMTYSNVEQRAIDFLKYSIQPWLTRIEGALASTLAGKQHLRFDTSTLLRTDLETTMRANAIGIASKQTTPDEARSMRDYAPLTDAQKHLLDLVPLTVTPTGRPGIQSPSRPPVVNFDDPAAEG